MTAGQIISVARDGTHRFGKELQSEIHLLEGVGVKGDAHCGTTVQHLSRKAQTPDAPNLRQVHLLQSELFEELIAAGFAVGPGVLGENVSTRGIDLLGLPRGTRLRMGRNAVIEVTGLRNPCRQIDTNVGPGAMAAVLAKAPDGSLVRRAGVMAIVISSGTVRAGDEIVIDGLPEVEEPLRPV